MYYFFIILLFLTNIADSSARNASDSTFIFGNFLSNINFTRKKLSHETKNASIDSDFSKDFLEKTKYKNTTALNVHKDSNTESTIKTQKKETFKISTNNKKESSSCGRCTLFHRQEIEAPEDNTNKPFLNNICGNLPSEYDDKKSCEFCECDRQFFDSELAAENILCQFCECQQNYYEKDNDNESVDDEDIDEEISSLDEDPESDDDDLNEYTEDQDEDDEMFDDDSISNDDYGTDNGMEDDSDSIDYGNDDGSMGYGNDDGSMEYGDDDGSMEYGNDDGSMGYGDDNGSMGYGDDNGSMGYGDDNGSMGYGNDDGSMGYGNDNGSMGYGDDNGSMGYGDDNNNSMDPNYDNSSMINNNDVDMNNDISNNMPLGTDQNTAMPVAMVQDNNSGILQSNDAPISIANQPVSENKPPLNDTAQNNIENSSNDTTHEEFPEQTKSGIPAYEKISDPTEQASSKTAIAPEESGHAIAEIESPQEKSESSMAAKIMKEESIIPINTASDIDNKSTVTAEMHKSQLKQPIQIDTVNINKQTSTINQASGSLRNSTLISSDTMLETDIANSDISFDEFSQTNSSTDQHKYDGKLTSEDF